VSILDEVVIAVSGFVAAGVSAVLPIGPIVDIWTGDLDAAFHQPGGGVQGGAACSVYQHLPDEIALPESGGPSFPTEAFARVPVAPMAGAQPAPPVQKNKLVINYSAAPQISDTAFVFAGVDQLKPRIPVVQIQGLNELTVGLSSFKTASTYSVVPVPLQAQDFYGNLTYEWTADSTQAHFATPNQQQTDIEFSTDPSMQPGQTSTQTLQVKMTDSEGSSATATLSVQILKLATNPPPPGPSVPGRCKQNPYAKGCPPTHPF